MSNLNLMTMLAQWGFLSEEDRTAFLNAIGAKMASAQPIKEVPVSSWTAQEIRTFEREYNRGFDISEIQRKLKIYENSKKTLPEIKQKYDEYKALGL